MYVAHPVPEDVGPLLSYRFERAVVEAGDDGVLRASFADGSSKTYGSLDTDEFAKLRYSSLAAAPGPEAAAARAALPCGIRAALPHVRCVNMAQRSPIVDFPRARLRTTRREHDTLLWVDGLAEELTARFRA